MNKIQFYTLSGALLASTALASAATSPVPRIHRFREGEPPAFNLQTALADPTTKNVLLEWAEREIAAGLKAKNKEIMGKLLQYKIGGTDEAPEFLDPGKARNAIAAVAKIDPNGKGNIEELIAESVSAAMVVKDREIEVLRNENQTQKGQTESERKARHNLLLDHELNNALGGSGVKAGKAKLHAKYLRDFLQVETDPKSGEERVIVLDADKKQRYGSQGLMKVADFVKEYSTGEDVAEDWMSDAKGGSGGGPTVVRGKGGRVVQIDPSLPPTQRMNAYRESQGQ